jgi:FkbM family methyltransferase
MRRFRQFWRSKHRLLQLFDAERAKAIARLFADPEKAKRALTFLTRYSCDAETVNGHTINLIWSDRALWDQLGKSGWSVEALSSDELFAVTPYGNVHLRPATNDIFIFKEIALRDDYKLSRLQTGLGTVVDLGGNIGIFASLCAPHCERLICVEPLSENVAQLQKNLKANALEAKCQVLHGAVWSDNGEVTVPKSAENSGGHSLVIGGYECYGEETVQAITLEGLFERFEIERVDLLKCDIEGAELEVFKSASAKTLGRIDRIILEIHPGAAYSTGELEQMVAHIQSSGFEIVGPRRYKRPLRKQRASVLEFNRS